MDTNDQQAINGTFSGASGIDSDPYRLRPLFETPLIRYQDRIAIRTEQTALTYRKLDRQSDALAAALIERGIDVGDRIALLMANQAMFAVADLAIVKADAARVPINDMLTPDEIETILSDSGVSTVLTGESFIETITDLRAQLPDLETVIATTDQTELPDGIQRLESLVDEYSPPPELDVTPSPDDTAGVFYTGGTTGKPKGVVHTQRGLAMNLYAHLAEVDITGDDTLLLSTPLSHSAGMFLWSGLLAGATIVVHDGFDRERVLEEIDSTDITWTFMVPTMIYRLLDTDSLETYDTMSLETILYGAAPMTAKRLRDGIDAFGPIFMQFYGQTEVPNLITTFGKDEHEQCLETSDDTRLSSAGHPTLMSDVRVVDIQTGDDVQPGDEGEILATAPYAMDRYHDRPEATAETLSNGWVHTGDIGRLDEAGYVYLLDRKSNVIITGGMNVYSTEVEDILNEHDDIQEVAVIGVPDDDWGEAVTAVVVPHDDTDLSEDDLFSFVDDRLADYKKPKFVDFREEIPKTPYGKMDKKALRKPYWEDEDRSVG